MEQKHIVVTGGHGFIGSKLVTELKKRKYIVSVFEGDVRKEFSLEKKFDILVHLAAKAKAPIDEEIYETNVLGTKNALEACKKNNAKLIFASTCGLYGNPAKNPVAESALINPFNAYNKSKADAEQLCREYANKYHLPVIILRLFNVYDPKQPAEFLIAALREAVKENKAVKLNPYIIRDFIHSDDIIEACIKAVEYKTKFDIFNIGSGIGYTAQDVVKLVEKISKKKIEYTINTEEVKIKAIVADITKAKKELKWSPKITLEQGITQVLEN